VADVTENVIEYGIVAEGAMAAVMADHEDAPHKEPINVGVE
jgi:hypothetical protein